MFMVPLYFRTAELMFERPKPWSVLSFFDDGGSPRELSHSIRAGFFTIRTKQLCWYPPKTDIFLSPGMSLQASIALSRAFERIMQRSVLFISEIMQPSNVIRVSCVSASPSLSTLPFCGSALLHSGYFLSCSLCSWYDCCNHAGSGVFLCLPVPFFHSGQADISPGFQEYGLT